MVPRLDAESEGEEELEVDRLEEGQGNNAAAASSAAASSAARDRVAFDERVQQLWTDRTGVQCWGDFASVLDAAFEGLLDGLREATLIYISGSPCPDFSSAGSGRGVLGSTGGLWLDDCELGIRLFPPVLIREMVTGIFDIDGGAPFWAAVERYKDAGYDVSWSVRMARRHGDPTSRRRVFLLAIRPDCLREGVGTSNFFTAEGTSRSEVTVASCLEPEPDDGLLIPPEDVTLLPTNDQSHNSHARCARSDPPSAPSGPRERVLSLYDGPRPVYAQAQVHFTNATHLETSGLLRELFGR